MQGRMSVRVPILRAAQSNLLAQISTDTGTLLDAQLINVSAQGVLIRSPKAIDRGDRVECKITNRSQSYRLRFRAEARWNASSDEEEFAFRVGLSVKDFEEGSQLIWDDFRLNCLEQLQAGELIDPNLMILGPNKDDLASLERQKFFGLVRVDSANLARHVRFGVTDGKLCIDHVSSSSPMPGAAASIGLLDLRRILQSSSGGTVLILNGSQPIGVASIQHASAFFDEYFQLNQKRAQKWLEIERAMTAHELRSPLSIIQTTADLLVDPKVDLTEIRDSGLIEGIRSKCEQGLNIVDRFMDAAKGKYSRRLTSKVDLRGLLQRVVREFDRDAVQKAIQIELSLASEATAVQGDELELTEVFRNLISNAIKYSNPGSALKISLTAENSSIRAEVRDHGVGISESHLAQLFSPFGVGKLQPTGGERQTGLGLFITKQLILKNQGTIDVQSCLGEGTTVIVSFPQC